MTREPVLRYSVELNGVRVPITTTINFNTIGKVMEEVHSLEDPYTKSIEIVDKVSGTITFKVPAGNYSNDPLTFLETLGHRDMSTIYNTTTESIEITGSYGYTDLGGGEISEPKIPIEIRQTEATGGTPISSGGTSMIAIPFKMPTDELTSLKMKWREATDGDVTSCDIELFTDNSGEPGSKVTNSNTLSPTIDPANGASYLSAEYETIDISNLLGTSTTTIGTKYWIVITATDSDNLYVSHTSNRNYYDRVMGYSGSWAYISNVENFCFILTGTQSLGGHHLKIVGTTQNGTYIRTYELNGCRIVAKPPSPSPQKSTEISFDFTSYDYTITET